MENKKIPRCPNIVKYNRTMVERDNIDTPNTQNCLHSSLSTGTSIKMSGVKLVLWS